MIIRNLENRLVNRLTGTVIHMDDENIHIRIDEDDKMDHNLDGCVYNINKMEFAIHDENDKVVGNRWQFPPKLGYAVIVDKAQGRTLEFLVIDCYNFRHCGQLGVAIRRAIAKYGLEIMNFNLFAATLKHPQCAIDFYKKTGKPLKSDRSCYRLNVHDANLVNFHQIAFNVPPQPNLQGAASNISEDMEGNDYSNNFPYDLDDFILGELLEPITPIQQLRNNILLKSTKLPSFRNFLSEQYHYLYGIVELYCIPPKGTKCNWCVIVAQLDNYLKSTNYKDQCKRALQVVEMDSDHKRVCTALCFSIYIGKDQPRYVT